MTPLFRRWRVGGLLLTWAIYWIGLFIVTLGPGIVAGWLATQAPENTSNIGVSFGSAGLTLTVSQFGDAVWSFAASLSAIAFWLAGPPILLAFWWMNRQSHDTSTAPRSPELNAGAAVELNPRPHEEVRSRERR